MTASGIRAPQAHPPFLLPSLGGKGSEVSVEVIECIEGGKYRELPASKWPLVYMAQSLWKSGTCVHYL